MRISDWSSDVCSSDLIGVRAEHLRELLWRLREARPHILLLPLRKAEIDDRLGSDLAADGADQFGGEGGARQVVAAPSVGASVGALPQEIVDHIAEIGRASGRERGCQSVSIAVVAGYLKKKK